MIDVRPNFSVSDTKYLNLILDFIDSLIIKSEREALIGETVDSARDADLYILAKEKRDGILNYELSVNVMRTLGISNDLIELFETDKSAFYTKCTGHNEETIVNYYRQRTLDNYVEKNPYYLMLNGEPVDESEYLYIEDIFEGGMIPVHKYSNSYHSEMYRHLVNFNGAELKKRLEVAKENGQDWDYLKYLLTRVPYYEARRSEPYYILHANESLFEGDDLNNFYRSYYEARDYLLTVPYIQKYAREEELYDSFMVITLILLTLERFFANKMESYMKLNFSNNEDRRLYFEQYGMEKLLEYLSEKQTAAIIPDMDSLISIKGSEEVVQKVLDIFKSQLKNIEIYRYMLMKTINCDPVTKDVIIDPMATKNENYNIKLVKVPVNIAAEAKSITSYLSNKTNHMDLERLAINDEYFGAPSHQSDVRDVKRKIIRERETRLKKEKQFSIFYTKYVGIVAHIDMTQTMISASNLFASTLFNNEEILESPGTVNGGAINLKIRDVMAAMNMITCHRHDMSDDIVYTPSQIASIMGFNTEPDLDELKELETSIIVKEDPIYGRVTDIKLKDIMRPEDMFIVEKNEHGSDKLEGHDEVTNPIIRTFYYNCDVRDALLKRIYATKDYDEYQALMRMWQYNTLCKSNHTLFKGHPTYTSYLLSENEPLYQYIMDALNGPTENVWTEPTSPYGERKTVFLSTCNDLITELVEVITKALEIPADDEALLKSNYTDNAVTFGRIIDVIKFFKHYTVQFATNDVVYDVNDDRNALLKLLHLVANESSGDNMFDSALKFMYDTTLETGTETYKSEIEFRHDVLQSILDELEDMVIVNDWYPDPEQRDYVKYLIQVLHAAYVSSSIDIESKLQIRDIFETVFAGSFEDTFKIKDWWNALPYETVKLVLDIVDTTIENGRVSKTSSIKARHWFGKIIAGNIDMKTPTGHINDYTFECGTRETSDDVKTRDLTRVTHASDIRVTKSVPTDDIETIGTCNEVGESKVELVSDEVHEHMEYDEEDTLEISDEVDISQATSDNVTGDVEIIDDTQIELDWIEDGNDSTEITDNLMLDSSVYPGQPDFTELNVILSDALQILTDTMVSIDGTDVEDTKFWVEQNDFDVLEAKYTETEAARDAIILEGDATQVVQDDVELLRTELADAIIVFNTLLQQGTMTP